jgi:hypothetical protein
MLRRIRLSSALTTLAVAVSALAWVQTAAAQKLEDGLEALNRRAYQLRDQISLLLRGEIVFDPKLADHNEAIAVEAKSLTYPFILEPREDLEKAPGKIDKLFRSLDTDLNYMARSKDKTEEVGKVFRNDIRLCALEVLNHKNARPIIKLNATRILARLAEYGQAELADDLVAVLRDPKENDGARYWALRGMRDLLVASSAGELPTLDKPRILKVAVAIMEFLAEKPPIIDATPADEIEGYRLLRREAIRTLSQVRLPMVNEKLRPAVVLAQFAGNDERIFPLPRFDERLEAAMGLLRLRPAKDAPGFQPDYTAEQLAHLISYFGTQANARREKKDYTRLRAWKVDAARMVAPVIAFRSEVKDPAVADVCGSLLRVLIAVANDKQAPADDLTTLSEWKAPNRGVFQGVNSAVKPAKQLAPIPGDRPPETDK